MTAKQSSWERVMEDVEVSWLGVKTLQHVDLGVLVKQGYLKEVIKQCALNNVTN